MRKGKGKVKRAKDEEVNGQGGKRVPWPHAGPVGLGTGRYLAISTP